MTTELIVYSTLQIDLVGLGEIFIDVTDKI